MSALPAKCYDVIYLGPIAAAVGTVSNTRLGCPGKIPWGSAVELIPKAPIGTKWKATKDSFWGWGNRKCQGPRI